MRGLGNAYFDIFTAGFRADISNMQSITSMAVRESGRFFSKKSRIAR